MSTNSSSDEQQAAATSAFLAAMQQSHRQLQQEDLKQPPAGTRSTAVKRESTSLDDSTALDAQPDADDTQPPRKAPRRSSANASKDNAASPPAATAGTTDSATAAGPPYICPTCQTSYSRLEYLRRHERRHQDIRPFVCECGKGFSRSDVLSRHKRQCHYHLTGEQPSAEAVEAAAKKTRKPSMANKSRKKSSGDTGDADTSTEQKSHRNGKAQRRAGSGESQSPPPTSLLGQSGSYANSTQPGPPPPLLPQNSNGNGNGNGHNHGQTAAHGSMSLPPPPPFYNQQQQPQHGTSTQSGGQNSSGLDSSGLPDYSRTSGFMSAIHHALNNFGPSHHSNYPPSPESSASVNSRNSSPRLHYRDAIPYTQRSGSTGNSRQSSLRKGTLDPYHAPPLWETQEAGRSSPAPGSASSSRHGSVFGGNSRTNSNNPTASAAGQSTSASNNTSSGPPAFSYPANEFASAATTSSGGSQNQTLAPASDSNPTSGAQASAANVTARGGDSGNNSRFNVSTGPLSPFSGMGLSSISPYLSAFSNARDTPLVSSPGRGIGPGTPNSSLNTNVFDYTMRPPPKPASNTTPGKPGGGASAGAEKGTSALSSIPLKRKESSQRDEPTTPSASIAMSATESSSLPALADFIDDQQRNAANGLLTLLGGGGAETPSRFVRGEGSGGALGSESRPNKGNNAMDNNPGATSANPSSNPFFEPVVTPGPEAFLLRLQGGEQERRAGLLPPDGSVSGTIHTNNGPPTSVLGTGLDTPGFPAGFDLSTIASATPGQNNGIGWLLSPSIQALISSLATPQASRDTGSYFPSSAVKRTNSAFQSSPLSKEPVAEIQPTTNGVNGANGPIEVKAGAPDHDVPRDADALCKAAFEDAFEDASNPFFIPKTLFRACYSIPHWELPPLTRLSMLAMHAQQNLLKHVPIMHEPTFRIDTTPGCLAFAVCMLGSHEAGRRWWAGEEAAGAEDTGHDKFAASKENGQTNGEVVSDGKKMDEEDGQELVKPIVMTEKMDMLMRSFAGRCQHDKDKISVVQALMLFQINNFLSSDATTRAIACISHGSVVSYARKAGLYDPRAPHVSRDIHYTAEQVVEGIAGDASKLNYGYSYLPSYMTGCPDEEKVWRQWCEYEGRRRTAFIVLLMDMVASLDAGLPALLELHELKHLPLPAPDAIWRSKDAKSFRKALDEHPGVTFCQAMQGLFSDPDRSEADEADAKRKSSSASALPTSLAGTHGPFARLAMLLPVLQGIVHLLQGRADRAAAPSPLEPWLHNSDGSNEAKRDDPTAGHDWQVDLFKRALTRWREAWDADESCLQASSPAAQAKQAAAAAAKPESASPPERKSSATTSDTAVSDTASDTPLSSKTASGATPLCEDALPFYWLSHVLLGHATSRPVSVRSKSGDHATTFTLPGEGGGSNGTSQARRVPDFRSMLRFAKAFVNSGEGTNGAAGAWGLPLGGKEFTTSVA